MHRCSTSAGLVVAAGDRDRQVFEALGLQNIVFCNWGEGMGG
jgi:hypothetical protein